MDDTQPLKSDEQKQPTSEQVESVSVEEVPQTSSKTFFIGLGMFVVILVAIFLVPRFFNQQPQTLTEIHQETITEGMDTETRYVYNGYSFVFYDNLWYTQISNAITGDLYNIPLHFGPKNLTDIVITGDLDSFFNSLSTTNISNNSYRYYLTFDPQDSELGYVALASGELTQNLVKTFNIAPVSACIQTGTGCETVPIITCNSTDAPVMFLKSGSPTLVYAKDNCITIQGDGPELVRATDRLILKLYNVMI
ncbi:MAG: hypothetical protein WC254_04915 [Candidatus Woesearchaeota archaeon]|jgi:hypothetical protein